MKTLYKSIILTAALAFMLVGDVPLLYEYLVPDAEAIMGVRRRTARRTAVVVGSATAASAASQQAATAQQQQATAEQQAAVAQQQAATAQQQQAAASAAAVPIGTVVPALPGNCKAVTVSGASYSDCGGAFYKAAFQGNQLIYVVVPSPL